MEQLAADLPDDLFGADELLLRYGRWATEGRGRRRLDTADRYYHADRAPYDAFRPEPRLLRLSAAEAMTIQRALSQIAPDERAVLAVLYVPRPVPAEDQLQQLGVNPAASRELHVAGLRAFAALLRAVGL